MHLTKLSVIKKKRTSYDIIDIIDKAEMERLRKIYVFDEADIQVVQTFLK